MSTWLKHSIWFDRIVLVAATFLFTMIAIRGLFDPVGSSGDEITPGGGVRRPGLSPVERHRHRGLAACRIEHSPLMSLFDAVFGVRTTSAFLGVFESTWGQLE